MENNEKFINEESKQLINANPHYSKIINDTLKEQADVVDTLVKMRVAYVTETIFNAIQEYIKGAFKRSALGITTLSIAINPSSDLGNMSVKTEYPKHTNRNNEHTTVTFEKYKGEHEQMVSGELFRTKFCELLAKHLREDFGFTKTANSCEYKLELNFSILLNLV